MDTCQVKRRHGITGRFEPRLFWPDVLRIIRRRARWRTWAGGCDGQTATSEANGARGRGAAVPSASGSAASLRHGEGVTVFAVTGGPAAVDAWSCRHRMVGRSQGVHRAMHDTAITRRPPLLGRHVLRGDALAVTGAETGSERQSLANAERRSCRVQPARLIVVVFWRPSWRTDS